MMKVTILVPIYNAEKYIERCAISLFGQTYGDIEFVFVNDCSTDKSIDILKSVADRYPARYGSVKIVNHETNRGVAAARNTLLDNATGEYLLWVDADDFIETNAVEVLVRKVENTGADFISFRAAWYRKRSNITPMPWNASKDNREFIVDVLSDKISTTLWGKLMRRSLFVNHGLRFVEGLDMGEDLLLLTEVAYFAENFVTENKVLYYQDVSYYSSFSRSYSVLKTDMNMKILDNLDKFFIDKMDVAYYLKRKKLYSCLCLLYGICLAHDKERYNVIKSQIKKLKEENVRTNIGVFYRFFQLNNTYFVDVIWAYLMLCLKKALRIKRHIFS